mgnify:CR=1 FL=1
MAKIKMVECRLRETKLVPIKGKEYEEFDLKELVAKWQLTPSQNATHLRVLRMLKPDCFVGRSTHPTTGVPGLFYWHDATNKNDVASLLKRDPSFSNRLVEVWRVESAQWDSKFEETSDA